MKIKVKYFSEDYPRLEKLEKGDWIDLRVDSIERVTSITDGELDVIDIECINNGFKSHVFGNLHYSKGDIIKFKLGVAMELPDSYEALIAPRSSTFRRWGLIQTNTPGVIDNIYNGDNDEWGVEFIATRDGVIDRHDRVCQFRIQENQPKFKFEVVEHLGNEDRGGFGTTGRD